MSSPPDTTPAGIRDARTTAGFRVLNFELFAKPNKVVMIAGIVAFSSCVGYIAYWRSNMENKKLTSTINDTGEVKTIKKVSRWD